MDEGITAKKRFIGHEAGSMHGIARHLNELCESHNEVEVIALVGFRSESHFDSKTNEVFGVLVKVTEVTA